MKILTVQSQVWWVALVDEIRPLKAPPPGSILEIIQREFSFKVPPTEFKPDQGFEFRYGILSGESGSIAIDKLVAYNDGVNISVLSSTDDADRVLDKLLETIFMAGIRRPVTPPAHSYVSYIVADFESSIDRFFPDALFSELSELGPKSGKPHAINIGFQFDPQQIERRPLGLGNPGFRIERREGFPYAANRYFSVANTTTEKHMRLLEIFEKKSGLGS